MADYVEQAMQDMVPELDDLRRKRVFDDEEIRQIVKRRRDFEYRLQNAEVKRQEFLNYARYEVALECLRSKRSKALRWRRKTLSDFAGIRRLHIIFEKACRKYKGDKRMWYQHVDFCLKSGSTKVMSRILMKALRWHPREVHFWLLAADRELKLGHVKAARALLVRGLRFAPKSPKLWGEFLRLEVRVALHVGLMKEDNEAKASKLLGAANPWAPARLLLRRALGALVASPGGSAALLLQASRCLAEAREDLGTGAAMDDGAGGGAAAPLWVGLEEFAADVRVALAEHRPGVMQDGGAAWAEAAEEPTVQLWQLWWTHELSLGVEWTTLVKDVAASAPPAALRRCTAEMAAGGARSGGDSGDRGAGTSLVKLAEAAAAAADVETVLAVLEALEVCSCAASEAAGAVKSAAKKAATKLLKRAVGAHPSSGRLLTLAASDGGAAHAPRGLAAVPVARSARATGSDEAAGLLMLATAAPPEGAGEEKEEGDSAGALVASATERRRLLEALLRHLAPDASPEPLVSAHIAAVVAGGGTAALRAACDEVHAAAEQLWDLPARRAASLAATLDCELRAQPAVALARTAAAGATAKRLGARFEELLGCFDDSDPEKEDWWVRYMEFSQLASQWGADRGGAGRRSSPLPSATDIQVRAMRSVASQARFAQKAQALLRAQGGGAR